MSKPNSGLWLYGTHAVLAALANPLRKIHRLVATERALAELPQRNLGRVRSEIVEMEAISRLLPPGSVHQGIAIQCDKLPRRELDDILAAEYESRRIVLVLDQVTDPHNAGAALRSAAAFGVTAVVVQDRHAPSESGVLAKAASGALDSVPYIEVVNISRALERLVKNDFFVIGLTGDGDMPIAKAAPAGDVAIVLGSEGSGIRRLVLEHCQARAFIPIENNMESLNVSNAAAVALYEMRRGNV